MQPLDRTSTPAVRLVVPAVPANVALLRQAATGVAEACGYAMESVEDIRLAVTEACTNVVVHAYETEGGGTIQFEAQPARDGVTFAVRDEGRGVPEKLSDRAGLGLGLLLIEALAPKSELRANPGGRGSEIVMAFQHPPRATP